MDTEKTLDLNKPLFSYSRYERNEYGYGDDFIHRDGDGVDMQVFFNQATGEFVSKGVSISDFTNLVEGKSARDTNAWTRHSLDPKELLPDDISKVEIEGRTRIKKVNEDQPLFPNTGAGLLIQKTSLPTIGPR